MDCCMAKRIVEAELCDLQKGVGLRGNQLRSGCRPQGIHIFTRNEMCLQFADVVPTFRMRQHRVASQIALKIAFSELCVVEGAKTNGQSPQAADETELGPNRGLECSGADLADKREPVFSLFLSFDQRVAGHEIVGVQLAATDSRVTDFTDPPGEIEAANQELAPLSHMFTPMHHTTEHLECPGLKT